MAASVRFTMDNLGFLIVLAVLGISLTLAAKKGSPELEIQPADLIKQGNNVTITCKVTKSRPLEFVRIVRDIDQETYEISTNDVIKPHFMDTGRYSTPTYKVQKNEVEVQIQIKNIQGKDGGNIGCLLLPKGEGAYEDVYVFVPPKTVQLYHIAADESEQPVPNGGTLQLRHGFRSAIICRILVEGSDVAPSMFIKLDSKTITSRFEKNYFTDNRADENGFQVLTYNASFSYITQKPDKEENGKEITCSATSKHFPPVVAKAKLEILYPPELDCTQRLFAAPGTNDVKIACKGKMHPKPIKSSWNFGKKPNRTTLMNGESTPQFSARQESLGGDEWEFSITLKEVTEEDFKKYRLSVTNGVRTSESLVRLVKEDKEALGNVVGDVVRDGTNPPPDREELAVHGNAHRPEALIALMIAFAVTLCSVARQL